MYVKTSGQSTKLTYLDSVSFPGTMTNDSTADMEGWLRGLGSQHGDAALEHQARPNDDHNVNGDGHNGTQPSLGSGQTSKGSRNLTPMQRWQNESQRSQPWNTVASTAEDAEKGNAKPIIETRDEHDKAKTQDASGREEYQ